jgi:NADPH:quinone reductase-like Zn-dependent oxidoreductase
LHRFPFKIGITGSGTVVAVGAAVKDLRVGDAVYGACFQRPFIPIKPAGFMSEYVVTDDYKLLHKPPQISFEAAASLTGSPVTTYQCIQRGLQLLDKPATWLKGKTVFVPGALSGSGSVACQVFKNVYGVGKVISTVSTAKMGLVEEYLPGVVDQLVDYQTQDVIKEVGRGTVDFLFNTQWGLTGVLPLVNPKEGVAISIASAPSAKLFREMMGPTLPSWIPWILVLVNVWYNLHLWGTNVKQEFVSGNLQDREAVEIAGEWIAQDKIRPVMTVADMDDLEKVREKCSLVAKGKGGIGKLVIRI